jgi:hypothetical protein
MRKISTLGVVSAGLLLAGSPAQAVDTNMSSSLNIGIANGNQVHLPVQAPVNVCGNAISLLGTASAGCAGGATANYATDVRHGHGHGHDGYGHGHGGHWYSGSTGLTNMRSTLNPGIANGNQVSGLVQVPVNVCGNAIGLLGTAVAGCHGGSTANAYQDAEPRHHGHARPIPYGTPRPTQPRTAPAPVTAQKPGAQKQLPASKTRVAAPAKKKNEAGLLGNLVSPVTGLLGMGGEARGNFGHGDHGKRCGNVNMSSFGNIGIANGNQLHAPVQVPINVSGNAIALLGTASAHSHGGATANYC